MAGRGPQQLLLNFVLRVCSRRETAEAANARPWRNLTMKDLAGVQNSNGDVRFCAAGNNDGATLAVAEASKAEHTHACLTSRDGSLTVKIVDEMSVNGP